MKKIIFILTMLISQSLFAATLTTNTVPYVCQGGANPQLCNSNLTTDSSGNIVKGLGTYQSKSVGTTYQAATDGFVVATIFNITSSSGTPSIYGYVNGALIMRATQNQAGTPTAASFTLPVPKGATWEVGFNSQGGGTSVVVYWIASS